ncbi:angiopoietin-like protein 8 isoform X2 [Hoplias malabaricus]|uniref:angiopoietin-like protein 8 isoform X2 n=1 Tax=Hoplias malabaricus TaxID=27720 RepID=UPI00346377F0
MWSILCICVCVRAYGVSSSPLRPQRETQLAKADEVNVLMYGVLQLSESLHHMYQSTEAKLARVAREIKNTESVVQHLGQDMEEAARVEGQIKEGLSFIQAQTAALQAQGQQTMGLVNSVGQEDAELKQKLNNMEEQLSISNPASISALKETTQKHNTILKDLKSWTLQQIRQLERQTQQLAKLQKRTNIVS